MKVTFHVACGSNEQVVVEMDMKDVQQWDERVLPVLKKIEERVGDRSRRILAGNTQMRDLAQKDPQMYNLVHNLVLVCLGQNPQVFAEGMTDKEWTAPVIRPNEDE